MMEDDDDNEGEGEGEVEGKEKRYPIYVERILNTEDRRRRNA